MDTEHKILNIIRQHRKVRLKWPAYGTCNQQKSHWHHTCMVNAVNDIRRLCIKQIKKKSINPSPS